MTAVFRGRVQGVGFRMTACEAAASFAVSGEVSNQPDGSVRVTAEGPREACEAFAEALRARMRRFVNSVDVAWGEAEGAPQGFRIAHPRIERTQGP